MKNLKMFSLSIAMLSSFLTFGQEKEIIYTFSTNDIMYKIDSGFNVLKLKDNKLINISDETLFVINNRVSTIDKFKNLNIRKIQKINLINYETTSCLNNDDNRKNNVIFINTSEYSKNGKRKLKF